MIEPRGAVSKLTFNRTIVELKLRLNGNTVEHNSAFNRTIVELKPS